MHCQRYADQTPIQCQSCVNLMSIQGRLGPNPPIQCQFWANPAINHQYADPIPIQCQSGTNLPIHHQSTNIMATEDQYINLPTHHQSNSMIPIHQGITNPPIQCQSSENLTLNANTGLIHRFNANTPPSTNPESISQFNVSSWPIHHQSTKPLPILDQSTKLTTIDKFYYFIPILDQSSNPWAILPSKSLTIPPTQTTHHHTTKPLTFTTLHLSQGINRWHSNHPDWRSIGTRHVNNGPIQCTIPHLVKGTSTIRDRPKCLSGWWFRESILNDVPLKRQSMLTFSQSQTNMSIQCQSTNPLSISDQFIAQHVNPSPIGKLIVNQIPPHSDRPSNTHPRPICQSITNRLPILANL